MFPTTNSSNLSSSSSNSSTSTIPNVNLEEEEEEKSPILFTSNNNNNNRNYINKEGQKILNNLFGVENVEINNYVPTTPNRTTMIRRMNKRTPNKINNNSINTSNNTTNTSTTTNQNTQTSTINSIDKSVIINTTNSDEPIKFTKNPITLLGEVDYLRKLINTISTLNVEEGNNLLKDFLSYIPSQSIINHFNNSSFNKNTKLDNNVTSEMIQLSQQSNNINLSQPISTTTTSSQFNLPFIPTNIIPTATTLNSSSQQSPLQIFLVPPSYQSPSKDLPKREFLIDILEKNKNVELPSKEEVENAINENNVSFIIVRNVKEYNKRNTAIMNTLMESYPRLFYIVSHDRFLGKYSELKNVLPSNEEYSKIYSQLPAGYKSIEELGELYQEVIDSKERKKRKEEKSKEKEKKKRKSKR
ncbi:hypothetical protein ABK040_009515 [Willaertia magna]